MSDGITADLPLESLAKAMLSRIESDPLAAMSFSVAVCHAEDLYHLAIDGDSARYNLGMGFLRSLAGEQARNEKEAGE